MSEMPTHYTKRLLKITPTCLRISSKVLPPPLLFCFECSFQSYCRNLSGAYSYYGWFGQCSAIQAVEGMVTNPTQTHYPALTVRSLCMPSWVWSFFHFPNWVPRPIINILWFIREWFFLITTLRKQSPFVYLKGLRAYYKHRVVRIKTNTSTQTLIVPNWRKHPLELKG